MKEKLILTLAAFAILFGSGLIANAQIKRVEMRIGGYLCGN